MKAHAYVDGSYNKNQKIYGYGLVFIINGQSPQFYSGSGHADNDDNGWNINGELRAALDAIKKAGEQGVTELIIHHDYLGIGMWADGKWSTEHDYILDYIRQVRKARENMKIVFIHVRGHSGDKWNEKADELAKKGAGIKVSSENKTNPGNKKKSNHPQKTDLNLPEGLNETGEKSIKEFYGKPRHDFNDYAKLKTGGIDRFSYMQIEPIKAEIGERACREIKEKITDEKYYMSALRWAMRGLTPEDAAKKVNTDAEIKENLEKKDSEN